MNPLRRFSKEQCLLNDSCGLIKQSVDAKHGLVQPKNAMSASDASSYKGMEAQAIFWQH
ncbi:MAG: hypothetical protein HOH29_08235 [Cellvibrionales bacterium]|nr:hypothetical protein [Cellvibrionales bacterium]